MAKSLLERAADWQKDKLDANTAVEVSYVVGVQAREGLKAVKGNAAFGVVDVESIGFSGQQVDWIVRARDLVVNSVLVEPSNGHQVWRRLEDGQVEVFELLPLVNDRCYSPSDQHKRNLRLHTKLKEVRPAP